MNVLVVYGTTEGQTRIIAERTAAHIRECGQQAALRDSAAFASDSDVESFDAFIIASSVHQQQHQETITAFVIAHRKLLNAKPSAFIPSACRRSWRMDKRKRKNMWIALSPSRIGSHA